MASISSGIAMDSNIMNLKEINIRDVRPEVPSLMLDNEKIYGDLDNKDIYVKSIIDFISGMTDAYAIELFNELITFE